MAAHTQLREHPAGNGDRDFTQLLRLPIILIEDFVTDLWHSPMFRRKVPHFWALISCRRALLLEIPAGIPASWEQVRGDPKLALTHGF